MLIKVKAVLPENQFGFYDTRRRRDGEIFNFDYDENKCDKRTGKAVPLEKQLGGWMEPIEKVKKKPGPKPTLPPLDKDHGDNNLRATP